MDGHAGSANHSSTVAWTEDLAQFTPVASSLFLPRSLVRNNVKVGVNVNSCSKVRAWIHELALISCISYVVPHEFMSFHEIKWLMWIHVQKFSRIHDLVYIIWTKIFWVPASYHLYQHAMYLSGGMWSWIGVTWIGVTHAAYLAPNIKVGSRHWGLVVTCGRPSPAQYELLCCIPCPCRIGAWIASFIARIRYNVLVIISTPQLFCR